LRSKITEKHYQVRNFAEVRNFAWHRLRKIFKSDSCSDSGCHRCNRNSAIHRLLLLKMKSDSGSRSGFSQIFDSGSRSERKTQDPAGVDSGIPDP